MVGTLINLNTKALMRLILFSPKFFCTQPALKFSHECRLQKENGILYYKRLRHTGPSERVVHIFEDTFLTTSEGIKFYNLSFRRDVIVGQHALASVLALTFLRDDGVLFILDTVYLLTMPSTQSQQVVIKREQLFAWM